MLLPSVRQREQCSKYYLSLHPQMHFLALLLLIVVPGGNLSTNGGRIRVPEVHHLKGYRSPLDEGTAPSDYYYAGDGDSAAGSLADEDFPEEGAEGPLFPAGGLGGGNEEPLCQQQCLAKFSEAVKSALQSGNNFDRFKGVCQNYNDTVGCMDKLEGEHCSNQETFHVFTSGLRYMCIEQRKAFDAVIECVDAQAADVEKECEEVCHVKERLAHWAVQSGILDNFMQGALSSLANGETLASQIFGRGAGFGNLMGLQQQRDDGDMIYRGGGDSQSQQRAAEATIEGIKQAARMAAGASNRDTKLLERAALQGPQGSPLSKRITPDFMRAVVQDGCELTRCQLICVRVKFDAKCGSSAGALLSEAFVRPISQAQEFLTYGHIAPFMGAFLPHQCDFMVKKEVLNEFRIPPELDDALHRKYDDEQQQQQGGGATAEGSGEAPSEEQIGIPTGEPPGEQQSQASPVNQPTPAPAAIEPNGHGQAAVAAKATRRRPSESAIPVVALSPSSSEEEEEKELTEGPMGEEKKHPGVGPGDRTKVGHLVGRTMPRRKEEVQPLSRRMD